MLFTINSLDNATNAVTGTFLDFSRKHCLNLVDMLALYSTMMLINICSIFLGFTTPNHTVYSGWVDSWF